MCVTKTKMTLAIRNDVYELLCGYFTSMNLKKIRQIITISISIK